MLIDIAKETVIKNMSTFLRREYYGTIRIQFKNFNNQ